MKYKIISQYLTMIILDYEIIRLNNYIIFKVLLNFHKYNFLEIIKENKSNYFYQNLFLFCYPSFNYYQLKFVITLSS